MRKLLSAVIFYGLIVFASSLTWAEAEEASRVLGYMDGTLIARVNEVAGTISSGEWDLDADFDDRGPEFTDPDMFRSEGTVNSNLTVSNAVWQVLDGSGDVLYSGTLDFPTDLINHVISGSGVGPVNGEIILKSGYFPNLVLSYMGNISEISGGYRIVFDGILTYTQDQTDVTPDDSSDEPDDGGSGGCFISDAKRLVK